MRMAGCQQGANFVGCSADLLALLEDPMDGEIIAVSYW